MLFSYVSKIEFIEPINKQHSIKIDGQTPTTNHHLTPHPRTLPLIQTLRPLLESFISETPIPLKNNKHRCQNH